LFFLTFGILFYFLSTFLSTFLQDPYYILVPTLFLLFLILANIKGWLPGSANLMVLAWQPWLEGGLPWLQMAVSLALRAALFFASVKIVESQEY
jgi:hypothetical protein